MKLWFKQQVRRFALYLLSWVDDCPTCGMKWQVHSCPVEFTPERICGVCECPLPVSALRTHDGKWRCRQHKEMT